MANSRKSSKEQSAGAAIVFWPINRLKAYERNAKKHGEDQVAAVAASISEFGFTMPILVRPNGKMIAGHGRDLAAKLIYSRGETFKLFDGTPVPAGMIPVIVADGWTETQCRAYGIADNRLTELGEIDPDLLRLELGDLKAAGFNLDLTGYMGDDLDRALTGALEAAEAKTGAGSLAARFGIPPFSVLNAREGWWQDRKAAWIALGIRSELGRGAPIGGTPMPMDRAKAANATPGGSALPAANYSRNKARGDGRGRAVEKTVIVAGNGWGNGGPARRDAQFYSKKRAWEKTNGRKISTAEFRAKHWDGAARG